VICGFPIVLRWKGGSMLVCGQPAKKHRRGNRCADHWPAVVS